MLSYHVDNFAFADHPGIDAVCEQWRENRFPSPDECIIAGERVAVAAIQQKLKRYADYLESEMAQLVFGSSDLLIDVTQIDVIKSKGRRDAQDVKNNGRGAYERCAHRCATDGRCMIDCVAQVHPTAASALWCAMLPDDLPY